MGTVISEVLYGGDETIAKAGMNKLTELEEGILSWSIETSEINKINTQAGSGEDIEISWRLEEYLAKILQVSKDSNGAFDPTIGMITRLWGIDSEDPKVPDDSEIQALLKNAGYENIDLQGNEVKLPSDVSIDLGAVGKGIGTDIMMDFMQENEDIKAGVISVGGSIVTYGNKPEGGAWKVGITDPRDKEGGLLGSLQLEGDHYISTSGDYEKYIEVEGKRYHHIMDPKTGYPANSGLISVTIVCDSGLLSDALSTACFVLGYEESLPLLETYHAQAVFVDNNQNVYITDGLIDCFKLVSDNYIFVE